MSFQTCMSFFLMLNIKVDILKNAGNQTVDGPHWLSISFPTLEVNGDQQLFDPSKFFKISSFVLNMFMNYSFNAK